MKAIGEGPRSLLGEGQVAVHSGCSMNPPRYVLSCGLRAVPPLPIRVPARPWASGTPSAAADRVWVWVGFGWVCLAAGAGLGSGFGLLIGARAVVAWGWAGARHPGPRHCGAPRPRHSRLWGLGWDWGDALWDARTQRDPDEQGARVTVGTVGSGQRDRLKPPRPFPSPRRSGIEREAGCATCGHGGRSPTSTSLACFKAGLRLLPALPQVCDPRAPNQPRSHLPRHTVHQCWAPWDTRRSCAATCMPHSLG